MLMLPIVLVPFLLILLIAFPLTIQLVRARRQCQLLWMLAVTVRSNRELSSELRTHASCFYGLHAASIRQLAIDLEVFGMQLGDALLVARENALQRSSASQRPVRFFPSIVRKWIFLWRLLRLVFSSLTQWFFGSNLLLAPWAVSYTHLTLPTKLSV